ncbi:hypothetical protein ACS0TY_033136 [Phlomoides rotata]
MTLQNREAEEETTRYRRRSTSRREDVEASASRVKENVPQQDLKTCLIPKMRYWEHSHKPLMYNMMLQHYDENYKIIMHLSQGLLRQDSQMKIIMYLNLVLTYAFTS